MSKITYKVISVLCILSISTAAFSAPNNSHLFIFSDGIDECLEQAPNPEFQDFLSQMVTPLPVLAAADVANPAIDINQMAPINEESLSNEPLPTPTPIENRFTPFTFPKLTKEEAIILIAILCLELPSRAVFELH